MPEAGRVGQLGEEHVGLPADHGAHGQRCVICCRTLATRRHHPLRLVCLLRQVMHQVCERLDESALHAERGGADLGRVAVPPQDVAVEEPRRGTAVQS